jgi:hypothetical protein
MRGFSNSSSPIFKLLVTVGAGIVICLYQYGFSEPVFADSHAKVRMYKMNSKGQSFLQRWIKNKEVEGCHSLSGGKEVQRFSQTGYNFCQLYAEDNCLAGSEVPAMWGGKRYRVADIDISEPQIKLLRGTKWLLAPDKNVSIRSWYCEY